MRARAGGQSVESPAPGRWTAPSRGPAIGGGRLGGGPASRRASCLAMGLANRDWRGVSRRALRMKGLVRRRARGAPVPREPAASSPTGRGSHNHTSLRRQAPRVADPRQRRHATGKLLVARMRGTCRIRHSEPSCRRTSLCAASCSRSVGRLETQTTGGDWRRGIGGVHSPKRCRICDRGQLIVQAGARRQPPGLPFDSTLLPVRLRGADAGAARRGASEATPRALITWRSALPTSPRRNHVPVGGRMTKRARGWSDQLTFHWLAR